MGQWRLDDIPWHELDRSKLTPDLIAIVKAACMVEHHGADYGTYLGNVFHDDLEFVAAARAWAVEEVQHGQALRKYAELADPSFDFDDAFGRFVAGHRLPLDVSESVRGSRCGELIARCIVEVGTSSFYSAIRDAADEPVLKHICNRIAGDEFRHYKLFYDHLRRYRQREDINLAKRLRIAFGRVAETGDDELATAYWAGNDLREAYDRERHGRAYA
ncbi:MAG TPA: ferritin-like domain-containing protein, partial [Alphaproteobacteria bacterium]|nr:ferritin-like domain-containing protein [Alphaproteobacteria bacterium]